VSRAAGQRTIVQAVRLDQRGHEGPGHDPVAFGSAMDVGPLGCPAHIQVHWQMRATLTGTGPMAGRVTRSVKVGGRDDQDVATTGQCGQPVTKPSATRTAPGAVP
jgi:hypothetical protein